MIHSDIFSYSKILVNKTYAHVVTEKLPREPLVFYTDRKCALNVTKVPTSTITYARPMNVSVDTELPSPAIYATHIIQKYAAHVKLGITSRVHFAKKIFVLVPMAWNHRALNVPPTA